MDVQLLDPTADGSLFPLLTLSFSLQNSQSSVSNAFPVLYQSLFQLPASKAKAGSERGHLAPWEPQPPCEVSNARVPSLDRWSAFNTPVSLSSILPWFWQISTQSWVSGRMQRKTEITERVDDHANQTRLPAHVNKFRALFGNRQTLANTKRRRAKRWIRLLTYFDHSASDTMPSSL